MLDALQTLLTRATAPVFVDDEEDRLVLVVVDVIGRETIGDDELCDWIDTFGSWLAGRAGAFDPASRAAAVNLKRFVRTLHLALCSRAHRRELTFDKPEIAALDIAQTVRRRPDLIRPVASTVSSMTSHGALWATSLATEPSRRLTPCMRRLPTTISSASRRSASLISASAGFSSMRRRRRLDALGAERAPPAGSATCSALRQAADDELVGADPLMRRAAAAPGVGAHDVDGRARREGAARRRAWPRAPRSRTRRCR